MHFSAAHTGTLVSRFSLCSIFSSEWQSMLPKKAKKAKNSNIGQMVSFVHKLYPELHKHACMRVNCWVLTSRDNSTLDLY